MSRDVSISPSLPLLESMLLARCSIVVQLLVTQVVDELLSGIAVVFQSNGSHTCNLPVAEAMAHAVQESVVLECTHDVGPAIGCHNKFVARDPVLL